MARANPHWRHASAGESIADLPRSACVRVAVVVRRAVERRCRRGTTRSCMRSGDARRRSTIPSRRGACSTRSFTASKRIATAPWLFAMPERAARCAGRRDRRVPHAHPPADGQVQAVAEPRRAASRRASPPRSTPSRMRMPPSVAAWMREYGAVTRKPRDEASDSAAAAEPPTARVRARQVAVGGALLPDAQPRRRRRSTRARCASTASASKPAQMVRAATRVSVRKQALTWTSKSPACRAARLGDRGGDAVPRNGAKAFRATREGIAGRERPRARRRSRQPGARPSATGASSRTF